MTENAETLTVVEFCEKLTNTIRGYPGMTGNELCKMVTFQRRRVFQALDLMATRGILRCELAARNAKNWYCDIDPYTARTQIRSIPYSEFEAVDLLTEIDRKRLSAAETMLANIWHYLDAYPDTSDFSLCQMFGNAETKMRLLAHYGWVQRSVRTQLDGTTYATYRTVSAHVGSLDAAFASLAGEYLRMVDLGGEDVPDDIQPAVEIPDEPLTDAEDEADNGTPEDDYPTLPVLLIPVGAGVGPTVLTTLQEFAANLAGVQALCVPGMTGPAQLIEVAR